MRIMPARAWLGSLLSRLMCRSARQSRTVYLGCWLKLILASWLSGIALSGLAAPPEFAAVQPGKTLQFPHDYGAHPEFRTEWWYATGWIETPDGKSLGFQVTFFRSATEHDRANPSQFAPEQLIIAHAALSDPTQGKLLHDQKSAREGFGLAYARTGNTDIKLDDWTLVRAEDGRYQAVVHGQNFSFDFTLTPTQQPLVQGQGGFSRKGPKPEQASYYYSEPHLQVAGTLTRAGKPVAIKGSAWLDHEWSTSVLDTNASGWDWVGINLNQGAALMAFRIRNTDGTQIWAQAALRDAQGRVRHFRADEIAFTPRRRWRSPRTGATYPVALSIRTGELNWYLEPLQDDQELDSRRSTGAVYWEGAMTVYRDDQGKQPVGRGYLEMTGYTEALKL